MTIERRHDNVTSRSPSASVVECQRSDGVFTVGIAVLEDTRSRLKVPHLDGLHNNNNNNNNNRYVTSHVYFLCTRKLTDPSEQEMTCLKPLLKVIAWMGSLCERGMSAFV